MSLRRCRWLLAFVLIAPSASAQAPAWVGEWRLDVAQSESGPTSYVRGVRRLELIPSGVRIVEDFVRPRGGTVHLEWTGALDGRDRRVHGVDLFVTYAYRQIDERTLEGVVSVALGLDDVVGFRVGELPGRIYIDVAA